MAVGVFGIWAKKFLKDHSQAEIDYVDGVTAGTVTASKAVVVDASKKINELDITAPKFNGTAVSATAAEINVLAGVTPGTPAASKALVADELGQVIGLAYLEADEIGLTTSISHIADLKTDYTTGDLDTEAEQIAAINATNTALNAIKSGLVTAGLMDSE